MTMTDEQKEAYDTQKAWVESWPLCEYCGERTDPDEEHVCPVVERQQGEVRYEDFYDYAHEETGAGSDYAIGEQHLLDPQPDGEPY